jgi:hypothetical protein
LITVTTGRDVRRLLDGMRYRPERASQLVICSPFVDPSLVPFVVDLAGEAGRAGCTFRFITSEAVATMLREALRGSPTSRKLTIVAHPRLHAKAYLRVDGGGRSEAIVTSANLTLAGIESNVELGVRATTSSPAGCRLIADVRRILERLAFRNANGPIFS